MYERVLLPMDGSETSAAVFEHVLDIAAAHDATVHIVHVADTEINSLVQLHGDTIDVLERRGELLIQGIADRARDRHVAVVAEVLRGEPAEAIVDYAETRDIDLIVTPTHGRQGVNRFLLGSVTDRIVRTSTVPVLTLRIGRDGGSTYPYRTVLVPVDGSRYARAALEHGIEIAKAHEAALHLLHVVDTASLGVDVRSVVGEEALEEAAADIIAEGVRAAETASLDSVTDAIKYGVVYREIRSYIADHDVDLVVMGTHGRTGFNRYLLGSVTERLVRSSPVPVLTARDPEAME